jgi:APA family basic amino acid/polyamine antiporter
MAQLDADTWVRFLIWLGIGAAVYFMYSKRNSKLEREEV